MIKFALNYIPESIKTDVFASLLSFSWGSASVRHKKTTSKLSLTTAPRFDLLCMEHVMSDLLWASGVRLHSTPICKISTPGVDIWMAAIPVFYTCVN